MICYHSVFAYILSVWFFCAPSWTGSRVDVENSITRGEESESESQWGTSWFEVWSGGWRGTGSPTNSLVPPRLFCSLGAPHLPHFVRSVGLISAHCSQCHWSTDAIEPMLSQSWLKLQFLRHVGGTNSYKNWEVHTVLTADCPPYLILHELVKFVLIGHQNSFHPITPSVLNNIL